MPSIVVEGPVIKELDRKRTLGKEMTDVAKRIYENVSLGGGLLIDRHRG